METNGIKESDPDSISECFKGKIDDFILIKTKAEKKAEKKARQKAEKAALKATNAANQAAKGAADQPNTSVTAEKLSEVKVEKQPPQGNSDKQQGGKKRKNDDDEFDEFKVPKLTYTQAVKQGLMVEIRCTNANRELDQVDFNHIEEVLTEVFMEDLECTINLKTDILNQGLTQGVVWYSCKTEEAKEFIIRHARSILPPEGRSEYDGYKVFGPGVRPYRYLMLAGVKKELWHDAPTLLRRIRRMNPELNFETTGINGEVRPTHIRVSTGGKDKKKEINTNGHFMIRLEVDEVLLPKIITNGCSIQIGFASSMKVSGGGIEKMMRDMSISSRIALVDLTGEEPMN